MNKRLILSATLIIFGPMSMSSASAWCDEDCAYEAHEEAYERAAAREEAEEAGYIIARPTRRRQHRDDNQAYASKSPTSPKRGNEQQVARRSGGSSVRTGTAAASENSSIATGLTRVAGGGDNPSGQPRREVGCKTFFPTVGMTLSVPCD